jgi:ABC-type multidrug transport system fused ATPase/permease subunit
VFKKVLSFLFGVSPETVVFVSDSKKNYIKKLSILVPVIAWATLLSMLNPMFFKWAIDSLTEKWTNIWNIQLGEVWLVFLVISGGYAVLNILDDILNYLKEKFLIRLNLDAEFLLEDRFNNFLTKFDGVFLNSENNNRLVRNLQWSIASTQKNMVNLVSGLVEVVVGLGSLGFILPLLHPFLLVIIMFSVSIDSILDFWQNQLWRKIELIESRQSEQRWELKWRLNAYFSRFLENGWVKANLWYLSE